MNIPFLFFSVSLTIPWTFIPWVNFCIFSSQVPNISLYDKFILPLSLSIDFTTTFIFCPIFSLSYGVFILAIDKSSICAKPTTPPPISINAPYGFIFFTIPVITCPISKSFCIEFTTSSWTALLDKSNVSVPFIPSTLNWTYLFNFPTHNLVSMSCPCLVFSTSDFGIIPLIPFPKFICKL